MTFFMKMFSKVELRPRLPGPHYPLLLTQHTGAVIDGQVCPRLKIYPEMGKSMALNYFFAARINAAVIPFGFARADRSREISRRLKVPVDRRGKKSNDMTVEVAPAPEERSPQHSLPECSARESRMLVSFDPRPAS